MNIAIFTDTYAPHTNGVNSAIQLETAELEKRGHKVFIITVGPKQKTDSDQVLRIRSIPTVGIKTKQQIRLGIFDRSKIIQFLRNTHIDIVHTHTEYTVGWLGHYYAKKYTIPHIHTFHTLWEDYKDVYFLTRAIIPFGFIRRMLKSFLSRADHIITPSQKSSDYLANLVPATTVSIVQNGIPFIPLPKSRKNTLRKKYGFRASDTIALFAGRISAEKRVINLYRVYRQAMLLHPSLHLIWAGDGGQRAQLMKRAKEDEISNQMHFLGFVDKNSIAELNCLADIATSASLSETSNMSLLEGIASGCAVIARADPCLQGVVQHSINGYLCSDDLAMVEKIGFLQENPSIIKTMCYTNYKLRKNFTAQYHVENLLKAYQNIVESFVDQK